MDTLKIVKITYLNSRQDGEHVAYCLSKTLHEVFILQDEHMIKIKRWEILAEVGNAEDKRLFITMGLLAELGRYVQHPVSIL